MKYIRIIALLLISLISASLGIGSAAMASVTPEPTWNPSAHFKIVFDSEMNGSSVNTKLWNTGWFGTGITGPVNSNETDRYSSANVSESGGTLNLTLNNYGSLVDTDGKFSLAYGRVEFRAYIPAAANGQVADWPALWLDGTGTWPATGEIDTFEGLGGTAAYHFHSPAGGPGSNVYGNYTGWHTFGIYWAPGTVQYFYDGKSVGQIHQDITGAPMYLVIDNTKGDGGPPANNSSTLRIDWVRAWAY